MSDIELPDQLIEIARRIEGMKRECGMDPESPTAIHNAGLMSISYALRAIADREKRAQAAQGVALTAQDLLDRRKRFEVLSDAFMRETWADDAAALLSKIAAAPTEASKPVQAEAPTASNAERSLREALRHAAAVLKSDAGQQTRWATADGIHTLLTALATQQEAQPQTAEEMRPDFEWWWTTRGVLPPLGSREAAAAWSAWIASGGYKAPSDWKLSDAPWAWDWEQEAQPQAEPFARIEFRRGTPGKENDMPTVVSCDWLPDGIYEVYLADPTGVEPCCGEYAQRHRPCTPRGRWLAQAEPAGGDKEDADWPITWEVSWGELDEDDECSPCGWRVHDRRGSRNDREWELIATGNTPAEAIRAARAAQQTGERDHG